MTLNLAENSYGKRGIRLLKIDRQAEPHQVKDLTISILCRGEFDAAFTAGENWQVLPTDTMKNTIYALAASQPLGAIEDFGQQVAAYFLENFRQIAGVELNISQDIWRSLDVGGAIHPASFSRVPERRTAHITASCAAQVVRSGITDLHLLKTSGSSFAGFPRDRYTTLPESYDRLLQSTLTAVWAYSEPSPDYDGIWDRVRGICIQCFAEHESRSVQHTLYAIGDAVLTALPQLANIELTLPNQHCLPVNMAPFGIEDRNDVFMPVFEPHGVITARLTRP